jgi:hypothetical protein
MFTVLQQQLLGTSVTYGSLIPMAVHSTGALPSFRNQFPFTLDKERVVSFHCCEDKCLFKIKKFSHWYLSSYGHSFDSTFMKVPNAVLVQFFTNTQVLFLNYQNNQQVTEVNRHCIYLHLRHVHQFLHIKNNAWTRPLMAWPKIHRDVQGLRLDATWWKRQCQSSVDHQVTLLTWDNCGVKVK